MTIAYKAHRDAINVAVAPDTECKWHEETYYNAHTMGVGPTISRSRAGARVKGNYAYDARVMPEDAADRLADYDARIRALNTERREWLNEHFREWPVVTRANASEVVPTRLTKAEATRIHKATKKPPEKELAGQRQMLRRINQAISSVDDD